MLDRVVPVDLQLGELADSLLGDLDLEIGSGVGGESNTVGMLDSAAHRPAYSLRSLRDAAASRRSDQGQAPAAALNGLFSTAPRAGPRIPRHAPADPR